MRIGYRGYMSLIKSNVSRPADRLTDLYGQLTSGRRIQTPSDDPLAASRAVRGHALLSEIETRQFVIRQGQQLLSAADGALGGMGTSLSRVKDLGLQAAAPYLEAGERHALAMEVRDIADQLVVLGNTQVQDIYVFGGSQTGAPPLERSEGNLPPVLYHGNQQQLNYMLDSIQSAPAAFPGHYVFNFTDKSGGRPVEGADEDVFSLLNDLAGAIERGDMPQVTSYRDQVDACRTHIIAVRGQVGVATQRYQRAQAMSEEANLRTRELLSAEEDVDFAAAISDMQQQETIYRAALSLTGRLLEMPNLFEMPW